jgi:hypothetical protein
MRRDLEVIRKGLAQVWTSQGRKFATFEREGDEDFWVQYLDGELNVRWPFDEEPATGLARRGVALPAGAFHGWHAPGANAVIEVGDASLDAVALLVESLFARVFSARGSALVARVMEHR